MFGVLKLGKLGASMKKAGFNPRTLFAASEPGAWYDPSDLSTLFQDSSGTVPVTAVEQPVGLILDKSGRGNHAFQATATSRPVLQQDASGRYYLSFDGVDDFLQTSSINFTSTDKITVFAGVRKLSDAARGIIVEQLTAGTFGSTVFALSGPQSSGGNNFAAFTNAVSAGSAISPVSAVLAGLYFPNTTVASEQAILKINGGPQILLNTGTVPAVPTVDQPLFIGRRGGTSLPFNGRIYSLIIRGAQSTEQQIASAEAWVNTKTGAY